MRVCLSQEIHGVGRETRSHPASVLRPVHIGLLSSVSRNRAESLASNNCTKRQVTFSIDLGLRMVVMWGVASACP